MKNLFSDLNVEQMAQLLKNLIKSSNTEFNLSLKNGKVKYNCEGDLDLISIINTCEVAGKVVNTCEEDEDGLKPTDSWDDIVDLDYEKNNLKGLIDALDSDLHENWDNIPIDQRSSMIIRLTLLRMDLIALS